MYGCQSPDIRREKWKLLFDLGMVLFDAENIDILLTKNAENPFVEIILVASLASTIKVSLIIKPRNLTEFFFLILMLLNTTFGSCNRTEPHISLYEIKHI